MKLTGSMLLLAWLRVFALGWVLLVTVVYTMERLNESQTIRWLTRRFLHQ